MAQQHESALAEVRDDPASRKRFLKMIGGTGAAGALGILLAACGSDDDKGSGNGGAGAATTSTPKAETAETDNTGDIEIVNYALTLEYLEADFYEQAIASGQIKDKAVGDLATRIGANEQAHVEALIAAVKSLGGTPAEKPMTKFEEVIAGGPEMILQTAATVENLGAAAYLGQAGLIQNKEILAAALSIHSVEARHAAALNSLVGRGFKGDAKLEGSVPDGPFAMPMSMDEVLKAVQPFIAA